MGAALQVNQAIDRIAELAGSPVAIDGLLSFEFENMSLEHLPKGERRDDLSHGYASSVWLAFSGGSMEPNETLLRRWSGKRVRVTGILHAPGPDGGCGHMSMWRAEVQPYSIERVNAQGEPE